MEIPSFGLSISLIKHPPPASKYIYSRNAVNGSIFRSLCSATCKGTLGTKEDCRQPHSQQTAVLADNYLRLTLPRTPHPAGPPVFSVRDNILKLVTHVNQPPRDTGPVTGSFLSVPKWWNLSVMAKPPRVASIEKKSPSRKLYQFPALQKSHSNQSLLQNQ